MCAGKYGGRMNKKTVADDALISTDIDSIIKFISSKKRVELNTLAREVGIKPENLKKWISILEEEGYIHVEYHLLNEFVIWLGNDQFSQPAEEKIAEPPSQEKSEQDFIQPEFTPKGNQTTEEKPSEGEVKEANEKKLPASVHEEMQIDERVERIMQRLTSNDDLADNKEDKEKNIAEEISSSLSDEKKTALADEEKTGAVHKGEESINDELAPVAKNLRSEVREERMPLSMFHTTKLEKKPERRERIHVYDEDKKVRDEIASLKRSLSEYMAEIQVQKEEIERLKAERESLLANIYIPMETKFKATFDSIADRILEKENMIIKLKEHLVEFPNKIGDANKIGNALRRIKEESKRSLAANKEEMNKLKKSLEAEDALLKSEMAKIEKDIKSNKAELLDLLSSVSSLSEKEQEIKKEMEVLNKQLAEINDSIAATYAALSGFSQKRSEIASKIEAIKMALDNKTSEVSESYARLVDVKKAEAAIEEYMQDYYKKIEEIEHYVEQSEKELANLREFAEIKHMRSYLKELEEISSAYNEEFEQAKVQEQSMDERIREAKQNLEQLVKESMELIKNIEEKTSGKDFDSLLSQVKSKQQAMVATVREKSQEREKVEAEFPLIKQQLQEKKVDKKKENKKKEKGKKAKGKRENKRKENKRKKGK